MNWQKVIKALEAQAEALDIIAYKDTCEPRKWKWAMVASTARMLAECLQKGVE